MNTLPGLFQSSLLTYAPIGIVAIFALLMISGLLVTGSKPDAVAKAVGCTILKAFGLLLVSLSSIQIGYGLIAFRLPMTESVLGLVLLLVIGFVIMIHESTVLARIDAASTSVLHALFCQSCKSIGALIAIVSGLSLMMTFLLGRTFIGWEMSATLLLLGSILCLGASFHANGGAAKKTVKRKR